MASPTKAFFTTPEYILKYYAGFLDANIDPNTLNTFILLAQSEQTQQLLGYTLYNKYITDINSGAISLPADVNYKYLLDNFIMDSVSCWAIWMAIDTIHLRVTNKSVLTKNSQFSAPISPTQLNRIRYNIMERAQFWDTRTREYVLNNPGFYPEYFETTGAYHLTAKPNTYDNFFVTGKSFVGGVGYCNGYLPGIGSVLNINGYSNNQQ